MPMEKYKSAEEFELQKVEAQFSTRNKFVTPSEFSIGIDVCIFFANKIGVTFELEDGPIATADELLNFVATEEEVGLNPEALPVFAIWFISPFLEIQLKPHHLPYKIRHQWRNLLIKYTTAGKGELDFDEPILSFRRNVYFSKDDEMKIKNLAILNLLYEEAKNNILEGRYPCSEPNYCMLAAWQARIELGPYSPDIHTLDFWRTKLNKFLPRHARRSKWSVLRLGFVGKHSIEAKILEAYCNISGDLQLEHLQKKYLAFCWNLPYYGSAFFHGQIETPSNGLISFLKASDTPILVAINKEGVSLIDQHENTMILGLKYEELCWEFRSPSDPDNPECFPCLFLQFVAFEKEKKLLKMLQIFSKQAMMMDALITAFVEDLKQQKEWYKCEKTHQKREMDDKILFDNPVDLDEIDVGSPIKAIYSDALEPLAQRQVTEGSSTETAQVSNQLHRLSLATFNEDGECLDQMGSWLINK